VRCVAAEPGLVQITVLKRADRKHEVVAVADAGAVRFAMSDYGDALPHDLVHYVVERALGIEFGFWGLLARGAEFETVRAHTARNRRRLPPQTDPLVDAHLDELLAAESVVAGLYSISGVRPDVVTEVGGETVERVHAEIAQLNAEWQQLPAGAALRLEWPG
jgi:hypothetical protein